MNRKLCGDGSAIEPIYLGFICNGVKFHGFRVRKGHEFLS